MGEFDINGYYRDASSAVAGACDNEGMIRFIKSFAHVFIWGASFQGRAVAREIKKRGVDIECFWDIRYEELVEVDGKKVKKLFSCEDHEHSLVVMCIGNMVIRGGLKKEILDAGYENLLIGDYLYQGMICPFDENSKVNASRCSKTMECRQIYCERMGSIMRHQNPPLDAVHRTTVTLVINQVCSLACKYCTSYLNRYKPEERVNFPLEQIKQDIDRFFDSIGSVGTITVMGGEPFLHPQISDIIEYLCQKDNFGLISIATSGTCVIRPEMLKGLHDPRVNVSFSNYSGSISDKQRELMEKSIQLMKENGISYTVGLFSPEWIVPKTLYRKTQEPIEDTISRKQHCTCYYQIKNGKVHPCDFAQSVYSHHINDYQDSYFDLNAEMTSEERKKKLREYIEKGFYSICADCRLDEDDKGISMTAMAAEQGYLDFNKPLKGQVCKNI